MNVPATVTDAGDLRIETQPGVPLAESLSRWRREARHSTFDTGRYRCPYFVWGRGPLLVFIHGLCDIARSFVPVMETLRRSYTCVAYEQPSGDGDGAKLGAYRHEHLVADLFALIDHLRFDHADLFASSFGSTIALAAMAARPKRIRRTVLQGGFAYRPFALWERVVCSFARYMKGPMATLPLRHALHNPQDVAVFRDVAPHMWTFLSENGNTPQKRAVASRGLMIPRLDLRPKLPSLHQPVLMICGDRDPIVPRECEPALLEGLPNVERVEFPNCGHFPQYTHVALTAELAKQFLHAPECITEGCSAKTG